MSRNDYKEAEAELWGAVGTDSEVIRDDGQTSRGRYKMGNKAPKWARGVVGRLLFAVACLSSRLAGCDQRVEVVTIGYQKPDWSE